MGMWGAIKKAAAGLLGPATSPSSGHEDEPRVGELVVTQSGGVRCLNFGTPWIQGAMRLSRPEHLELEYTRLMMGWMLFESQPALIVQMGLGAGALAKFCLAAHPQAQVEVVEIDQEVYSICQRYFSLPARHERLRVMIQDARAYAQDPSNHGRASVLQVDVYDALAQGPVIGGEVFYKDCLACLDQGGWMCVNLFGDHASYREHIKDIQSVFGPCLTLGTVGSGNVIAMARKGRLQWDMRVIERRAGHIEMSTGWNTESWLQYVSGQSRVVGASPSVPSQG